MARHVGERPWSRVVDAQVNPYHCPLTIGPWSRWSVVGNPALPLIVTLTERGWFQRRFQLQGLIEADLQWRANRAAVFVNGRFAARSQLLVWSVYRHQLELPTDWRTFALQMDVHESLLGSYSVRIRLDGQAVFADGRFVE